MNFNDHKCFWRALADGLPDGLLIESRDRILYINEAYSAMLRRRPTELVGQHVFTIVADDDRERLAAYGADRVRGAFAPSHYRFSGLAGGGGAAPLDAAVRTVPEGPNLYIVTTVRLVEESGETAVDRPAFLGNQGLTPRQIEIAELLLAGKPQKEIGRLLDVDPKTVSTHCHRLLSKLHLRSIRDLFRFAQQHRLLN